MKETFARFSTNRWAALVPVALGGLVLIELGLWVPHYLTWPYWPDHDVFANVARAWDRGELPYRDAWTNNFPGTVYVLYVLGKLAGWGHPGAFYAFDAALVSSLALFFPLWSHRVFGRSWPGWLGSLVFLRYYLGLDYCMTAQRDWQGPGFAVLGLMVAQTRPGLAGRISSAGLLAFAFSIRPQTVLFWPSLAFEVVLGGAPGDFRSKARRGAAWLATLVAASVLFFLPLMVLGVFGDFLRSLGVVAYGSKYNQVGKTSLVWSWLIQPGLSRGLVASTAILWLGRSSELASRRASEAWLIAFVAVSFYKPLSPSPHPYLDIPLALVGSVVLAVLAGSIVRSRDDYARVSGLGALALLAIGTGSPWPLFSVIEPNLRAIPALRSGIEPEQAPSGYRAGTVRSAAFYPWADYRATLLYLRSRTEPTTRVANALKGVPAIVSEVDRPSAFPAESIAWLSMVNRDDERKFVDWLEKWDDSVVVWSPGEVGPVPEVRFDRLETQIRRLYRFEARFGVIEVWRRRASD